MSYTLNRTGAQIDAIGDRLTAESAVTEIANRTITALCSITIPAYSTWVINAQCYMPAGGDFTVEFEINDSTGMAYLNGHSQHAVTSYLNNYVNSISRIYRAAEGSRTIYLLGWQNSGSAIEITFPARNRLTAVRIA